MRKPSRDSRVTIEKPNATLAADGQQNEAAWTKVADRWAAIYPANQFTSGTEKADGNAMLPTTIYNVELYGYLPADFLPTWRLRVTAGAMTGATLNIVGVTSQKRGAMLMLRAVERV